MGLLGLTGTRGGISWSPTAAELDAYLVKRSVRLNTDDSAHLSKTLSSAGNRRTWTMSFWTKLTGGGTYDVNPVFVGGFSGSGGTQNGFHITFNADQELIVSDQVSNAYTWNLATEAVFRDYSSWYHVVVAHDTTQVTEADRVKIYVNGEQVTSFTSSNSTYPSLNFESNANKALPQRLGASDSGGSVYLPSSAYLADVHFCDGQQLDASSFGKEDTTTGQWIPKEYTHSTSDWHTVNDGTTWSDGTVTESEGSGWWQTSVPAKGFDGDITTDMKTQNGSTITFTPASGIPYTSSVEIYQDRVQAGATINGNAVTTPGTANAWNTLTTGSGTLNSLTVTGLTNISTVIAAIRIDGVILTDDAGDNSFHLAMDPAESGTTYSDKGATSTGGIWSNPPNSESLAAVNMFNGDLGTNYVGPYNTGTLTVPFGQTFSGTKTFSVYWYPWNTDETIKDQSGNTLHTSTSAGLAWHTFSGTNVSSLKFTATGHGNASQVRGIKVDGNLLVDHAAIGHDSSGNENHWHENNLVATVDSSPAGPIYKTADKNDGFSDDSLNQYLVFACPCNEGDGTLDMNDYHATIKGSGSNHSITATGWTSHSASSTTGHGYSADNNSNAATAQSSDFELSTTDDFCLEFWTYIPSSGLTMHARTFTFTDTTVNNLGFALYSNGDVYPMVLGDYIVTGGSASNYTDTSFLDAWCHWAITRDNGTCRIFQNGVLKATEANSGSMGSSYNTMHIGGAGYRTDAQFHDIRYYIGTPKYTAAFTPGGAPDLDLLADTPGAPYDNQLNGGGNCCTMNPLKNALSLANGNLDVTVPSPSGTDWNMVMSTMAMSPGEKYYCEVSMNNAVHSSSAAIVQLGVATADFSSTLDTYLGITAESWAWQNNSATGNGIGHNNSWTNYGSNPIYETGDVIGIAVDLSAGTLKFYKNGTDLGNAYSNLPTDTPLTFACGLYKASSISWNFGQRPFAYTNAGVDRPAADYLSLNTYNLTAPTITDPSEHFDVKLYDGTGSSQSITGLEFEPDLTWLKCRSVGHDQSLFDQIRGATQVLWPNSPAGDSTASQSLTAFTSDGFTVGTDNPTNQSTKTFASWNWNAGSSTVTNTDGSIDSEVRANTDAGFSIVSYDSDSSAVRSVGHGLSAEPNLIFWKDRDAATNWYVYHNAGTAYMFEGLNTANAGSTTITSLNNTLPSSSVFTLNSGGYSINPAGNHAMIAYCWHSVPGYSKFGLYEGNNSADGPFVHCGFKPRWIMLRAINSSSDWIVWDTARDTYNVAESLLYANLDSAEDEGIADRNPDVIIDVLSNGFKCRGTNNDLNASEDYLYCAFAETPFKYSNAR